MNKTIELLKKGFESSSGKTPEFIAFCRVFKKEITAELTKIGCTKIEVRNGHFYCYGFFTAPSGQMYYFCIEDVRYTRGGTRPQMYYRTVTDYKDFKGGSNQWICVSKYMFKEKNGFGDFNIGERNIVTINSSLT